MLKKKLIAVMPYGICLLFFIAYSLLSIIRHLHFESYGFDLGIVDQIVWKYSELSAPITTIQFYPFTSLLTDHVELIYLLLAPFYWVFSSPITLLILQCGLIAISGLPVFWLAKKKGVVTSLAYVTMIAYLCFYGIQNAVWFDVHSITFAAAFLPWLIYFLDRHNKLGASILFILAIISKEDVALLTLLISLVFFIKEKKKLALLFAIVSLLYLAFIFLLYFPHMTQDGYRYANEGGIVSDIQPQYLYDSQDKINVYLYSLGWFSFLPLFSPLFLIPAAGDIVHYFVLGNNVDGAHSLFMHYRVTLSILLVWPFIMTIVKYKKLNNKYMAVYLLLVISVLQYNLHVPLTYLTKSWFRTEPASATTIRNALRQIPADASVVAQNNIVPHLSQRDEIFTLWPEQEKASQKIQCESRNCNWFRWAGKPQYLIVDTAGNWDIRHLLANREDFMKSIMNLEKNEYIKIKYREGTTTLYSIEKDPNI